MFVKVSFYSTISVFIAYFFYFVFNFFTPTVPVNFVPREKWWANSDVKNKQDDPKVFPFEIKVSEDVSVY